MVFAVLGFLLYLIINVGKIVDRKNNSCEIPTIGAIALKEVKSHPTEILNANNTIKVPNAITNRIVKPFLEIGLNIK